MPARSWSEWGGCRIYRHPASTDESSESVELVWERRPELEAARIKWEGTNARIGIAHGHAFDGGNASSHSLSTTRNDSARSGAGARPPPPTRPQAASPPDGGGSRAVEVAAFIYSLVQRAPGGAGSFVTVLTLLVLVLALLLLTLLALRIRLELGLGPSDSEAEAAGASGRPLAATFDPSSVQEDQRWIRRSSELL